jgi:hypothetical protein
LRWESPASNPSEREGPLSLVPSILKVLKDMNELSELSAICLSMRAWHQPYLCSLPATGPGESPDCYALEQVMKSFSLYSPPWSSVQPTSSCLLSPFYKPGTVSSTFHILSHLSPTVMWGGSEGCWLRYRCWNWGLQVLCNLEKAACLLSGRCKLLFLMFKSNSSLLHSDGLAS